MTAPASTVGPRARHARVFSAAATASGCVDCGVRFRRTDAAAVMSSWTSASNSGECARHSSSVSDVERAALLHEPAHERADDSRARRGTARPARRGSRRRRSRAAVPTPRAPVTAAIRASCPQHRRTRSRAGDAIQRVLRVEQRFLVFLQILVVADRQAPSSSPASRSDGRCTRPALPRTSSSGSGFFFCGIRLLPVAARIGELEEAELLGREQDQVLREAAEVHHRQRGRVQERRRRSRGRRSRPCCCATTREKPSVAGEPADVDRVAGAGDRAGAERQLVDLRQHRVEAARDRAGAPPRAPGRSARPAPAARGAGACTTASARRRRGRR